MSAVKVGQVWKSRDKRRNTVIEIIDIIEEGEVLAHQAIGLVVGTEKERPYLIEQLTKRWDLVHEKTGEAPVMIEVKDVAELAVELSKFKTREQWLQAGVRELTKLFKKHGFEVPEVRVSVGWPGGRGKKSGVVGQCFPSIMADDEVAQIFVSPSVSDSLSVIATLAHEIVHAIDDCQSGHKNGFVKIAKAIGFLPKYTSSSNRKPSLDEELQKIVDKLGPFPHAAIREGERPAVQKTYMAKVVPSPECHDCDPEYKLRMTQKWIEEAGLPMCPHGVEMAQE